MNVENATAGAVKLVEEGQPYPGSVEDLLPHRPPFLFVDKLTSVSQKLTVGEMTYDPDMCFFKGHFPGYPVGPGVILVETMAQCGGAGVVAAGLVRGGGIFLLTGVDNAKFRHKVGPGDKLRMEVENVMISSRMAKQHGKAFVFVDGEWALACEADFKCVLVSKEKAGINI